MKKLTLISLAFLSLQSRAFAELPMDFMQDTIIGGEKVETTSRVYKMTVQLLMGFRRGNEVGVGQCSGTLIAKDLVLTAAHCVKNLEDPEAQFLVIMAKLGNGQTIKASAWRAHPSYKRIEDYIGAAKALRPINDIALVRLEQPAGAGTLLAQLPSAAMAIGQSEDMVVAGYGRTNPTDSSTTGTLFFAWTSGEMKSVRDGSDLQIEMTGVQPCSGDSGGPIFRASESKPLVVLGVTSHVKGQCESMARAISVSHHLPWIRATAAEFKSAVGK